MMWVRIVFGICFLWPHLAQAGEYALTIAREDVTLTGKPVSAITVNGTIPGPTLHWKEGEDVVVHVTNRLNEPSSIHWHGLLLPGDMDGAPGFNGFAGIAPNETFTYRFRVRQSGTYWYHSHSNAQEQEGLYGAIVIAPREREPHQTHRDYVLVLSDFTEEKPNAVLRHLKQNSAYYNYAQRTVGDFFTHAKQQGFASAWNDAKNWGAMRMSPTDLADVSGYRFLVNGTPPETQWRGLFAQGERVRLRFINAAAMSFFDLRIPGLRMTVIAADGQPIEPVTVDEFRIGIAETYDVLVTPTEAKPYAVVAEPIDRSGWAVAALTPDLARGVEIPAAHRPRALLTMADMSDKDMEGMDHSTMDHSVTSGWAQAGTPEGMRALRYSDLVFQGQQKDTRLPSRDITIRLGGNMERYIWTLNGKKYDPNEPLPLAYGERVRLRFINETMMAHPMHLHGMFMQLENGNAPARLPNKHTIIIPPAQTVTALLSANEPGEWPFHCHLLYHMLSGMMTGVVVERGGAQ